MDIVYCFLPKSGGLPPCGLGLLNAITKNAGFESLILDFNAEFPCQVKELFPGTDPEQLEPLFIFSEEWDKEKDKLDSLVEHWVNRIIEQQPKFLGISIFTQRNVKPAKELITKLRQYNTTIKIIIGGPYCTEESVQEFVNDFGVEYAVTGEGEPVITRILQNEIGSGIISSWQFGEHNVDTNPIPDYTGLDLTAYKNSVLYVTYSRSCPRSCTFCEVPSIWKSFRYRDPARVAEEILFYIENFGITRFQFTDSLINGDMTSYRQLLFELSRIKQKYNKFEWQAFYIIRSPKQMLYEDFKQAVDAGCKIAKIGVESGSAQVRKHMKKGFSPKALEHFMECSLEAGLKLNLLMMTGYPTETEEDFNESIKMLTSFVKYQPVIKNIRIDATGINKNLPLWIKHKEELGLSYDANGYWVNRLVSPAIRIERFFRLRKHAFDLGYSILQEQDIERVRQYNKILEMYDRPIFPETFKKTTNWD